MKLRHKQNQNGFTLTELAIVLGVFSIIVAGIWSIANIQKQRARVEQAVEIVNSIADGVRSLYGGQSSIGGGTGTVVAALLQAAVMPTAFVRSSAVSTCGTNTSFNAVDTPWASTVNITTTPCGTLYVCPWIYGTTTACAASGVAASQFFAIAFTQLDYGSCVTMASTIAPTQPPGLVDVYVNGTAYVYGSSPANTLPVTVAWAQGKCTTGSNANIVNFIYRLRPPAY